MYVCYLQVEVVCARPAVCVSCCRLSVEKLVAESTQEAGHRNHKTTSCWKESEILNICYLSFQFQFLINFNFIIPMICLHGGVHSAVQTL